MTVFFASTCPTHPATATIGRNGRRQCPSCHVSAGDVHVVGRQMTIDRTYGEPPTRTLTPASGADAAAAIIAAGWVPPVAAAIGAAFDEYLLMLGSASSL